MKTDVTSPREQAADGYEISSGEAAGTLWTEAAMQATSALFDPLDSEELALEERLTPGRSERYTA